MFPIPWNFPFRKKNGNVVNIEDAISGGGGGGSDLPSYDSEDAGKVLSVDDNGDLEWSDKVEDLSEDVESLITDIALKANASDLMALQEDFYNYEDILGAKNLLPDNLSSQDVESVSFTVNTDGSITVDGTVTPEEGETAYDIVLPIATALDFFASDISLKNTGIYTGADYIFSQGDDGTNGVYLTYVAATGTVNINVEVGTTVNNVTLYPMIRLSDTDDIYKPYTMTNQQLTRMFKSQVEDTQITNPNLIDNPFFTINQRGLSSYGDASGSVDNHDYSVDRWQYRMGSVEIVPDGIKCTPNKRSATAGYIITSIEDFSNLAGKEVTISIDISDINIDENEFDLTGNWGAVLILSSANGSYIAGTTLATRLRIRETGIFSRTVILPSSFSTTHLNLFARFNSLKTDRNTNNSYFTVRSMKLEIGDISTLAMDTAPNYATELLKCQRYFQVIPETTEYRITAAANASPFVVDTVLNLPVPMRAKPSIVDNGVELDIVALDQVGFAGTSKSIPSLPSGAPYSNIILRVGHSNPAQVSDGCILIYGKNLELSADL